MGAVRGFDTVAFSSDERGMISDSTAYALDHSSEMGGYDHDIEIIHARQNAIELRSETQGGLTKHQIEHLAILEAQEEFALTELRMADIALQHPVFAGKVGKILLERLEVLKKDGHPVDAEMYLEAQDLANEIVTANPDKNASELITVTMAMVEMVQAERRVRQLTLAA